MSTEINDFTLTELDRKTLEPLSDPIQAVVPGDVFTALMNAGRIPDPYKDLNSRDVQWVDDRAWLYQHDLTDPNDDGHDVKPGRRYHIAFLGLDYISRIELNDTVLVPRHEGMFSRVDVDITDAIEPHSTNTLKVLFFGIPETWLEKTNTILGTSEFGRSKYLKTQMSFDWDFAPRLKGAGIWDRVYIYETGPVRVKDVFVKPRLDGILDVDVDLDGDLPSPGLLEVTVKGVGFKSKPVTESTLLMAGDAGGAKTLRLKVDDPRLWWPWDMGEQNLYWAEVKVYVGDTLSDQMAEPFGIREITWGPNPDAPKGSADWVLFVNGKREFMRGANWVPPEAMYGRMDDTRYEKLIDLAKGANVNMLRVWGGGNRERRAFYDYCDQKGVMVWQEFPFACVYIKGYPRSGHFKSLVYQEVEEITRQLRNHPSLIMWCGGNEFNVKQNKHVVNIMSEVTSNLDPTRRFIPASPYKGDSHNWVVWHMKGNLQDYFDDISPLPSEFGLQGFANPETWRKWISPEYQWPINEVHIHHDLGREKMDKYVSVIGSEDTLDSYAEASQIMQAHYLQRGIENWRQRKYKTSGTCFWQLNEPWPSINWSIIDYDLKPKYAYDAVKWSYNPVLVTAKYVDRAWGPGDTFKAEVMVVNDLHEHFEQAAVTASLCDGATFRWNVDMDDDSVAPAGSYTTVIPESCEKPWLNLRMDWGGEEVSRNTYAIWIYDDKPAGIRRSFTKLGMWMMSGAAQEQWKK